ncbi:ficolin-3-like [Patiria miniata]|uniref:Fibrinogen C-terminal domain-containing protein n=1 Tax=Patiria miniata TaxID=46514 RepID=A0A914BJG9_PATMI|nr:ficolin-3-like [Patiria miniata]
MGNHCPSITPVSIEFYGGTNQALNSSSYGQSTVPNAVICGRDCHADPNCKSFSYHRCSRVCELHRGTRRDTNLVETTGSVYFDSRQDTPNLSVEYLDDRYCSCKELLKAGYNTSGVYTIYPAAYSGDGLRVHCDMDTAGGGWVTIQRRQDGSVNFFRNWTEYRAGFGNLTGEFWLGNAALQGLTTFGGPWVIRFDFEDWYGNTAWAEYSGFQLLGGAYTLSYDVYNKNSTAGNSLWQIENRPFQTEDNHNSFFDVPSVCQGGWWYDFIPCGKVNLNGVYYSKNDQSFDSTDAIK